MNRFLDPKLCLGSRNLSNKLHRITGAAAIVLMMAHAIWATLALALKQEKVLRGFHRFSLAVWGLWLVPFLSGMFMAMVK